MGGVCLFGRRLRWNKGIDALQGQAVICESGAFCTVLLIVEFAVPKGVTNGSEADDVDRGRFHINDHFRKEGDGGDCVFILVCTSELGMLTLCRVEGCP